MKIAFVYDVIYPYVKGGGERRHYELAKRLCLNHEIHILGMKFWAGNDVIQTEDGVFLHGVCPAMELYVKGRRSIYQAIYYSIKLARPLLKENFDLIDCHNVPYFPIFTCKLYSLLKRRPLIVAWLEYWEDYWYQYLGKLLGLWGKWIEKLTTNLPDHFIAISEHTKKSLIENGVKADTITTIHLGISLDEIKTVEPSSVKSDLIFVGRLIKDKRVDILVYLVGELVKRGLSIKCCIVGDGPERTNLENLCSDLGLKNNITFLGALHHHRDVYALMKSSKVFTFFSTREGFGIVVPEANACGLPAVVVKARHNAASSLVKNEESGFICELDLQEITDTVCKLLTDDDMRTKMGRAAVVWAQQFDWDVTAKSTEQIYERLIA